MTKGKKPSHKKGYVYKFFIPEGLTTEESGWPNAKPYQEFMLVTEPWWDSTCGWLAHVICLTDVETQMDLDGGDGFNTLVRLIDVSFLFTNR